MCKCRKISHVPTVEHPWSCRPLLRWILIVAFLLISPVAVRGGDIVHEDDEAPKQPGCNNKFVLVKVQTYINNTDGTEFVGVGARFGTLMASKEKHANRTRLSLANPRDLCTTSKDKLAGEVLVVHRGTCMFTTKAKVAQAAGASAILIINNRKVAVQLYSPERPLVDTAEVFLWLMAVGTILVASYWSAWSAREASVEHEKLLKDAPDDLLNVKDEGAGSVSFNGTESANKPYSNHNSKCGSGCKLTGKCRQIYGCHDSTTFTDII